MKKSQWKGTINATMQERLSALLVLLIGVMGILLIFPLVGRYMESFSYPPVVSFNRLGTYIISAWPVSILIIIIGGYAFFTGDKNFIRFKTITIWSCRITMLGLIVATLFNWQFTTTLEQRGYGTCWKRTLYGETLYIKDASECKKRGLSLLKKPRPAYQR